MKLTSRSVEKMMNSKFFELPEEKQKRIINAGFRVFSENSYRNSSMSEIAGLAGISKSLLFHYFRNKKEFYMVLWDVCASETIAFLQEYGCYGQRDFFETLKRGLKAKSELIRLHPEYASFTLRAFYEHEPEIQKAIQESYHDKFNFKKDQALLNMDPGQFRKGIDVSLMYQEMYWASEGYLWEMMQKGKPDYKELETRFEKLIAFWKVTYGRKEED